MDASNFTVVVHFTSTGRERFSDKVGVVLVPGSI